MRFSVVLLIAFSIGALTAAKHVDAKEPAVTTETALRVRFTAETGKFYQLESASADGKEWNSLGPAIKGAGQQVVRHVPGEKSTTQIRVRELKNQWVLVWADEFDGKKLDMTKWGKEENGYGGGNGERQFYSTSPKYCYVKDGRLHIAVHRDSHTTTDGKTQPYSSARIRTLYRGDWKYGKFEIRAKVPGGQGIWPAFWMMPTDPKYGTWASSGEIDILESRGSKVEETLGTIHFGGKWPRNKHVGKAYKFPGKNAAEAFHTYAIEWEKDEIRWYVDGKLFQTRKKKEWFSEVGKSETAPFDQPFHLILNVAVDGNFFAGTGQQADKLPASAFPQVFQVDYVRVYQWAK